MPPHSSHLHQPLDVGCFSVLKRCYGDLVKAKMVLGVHHIDKPIFLELFLDARKKTFSLKNITSGFAATGLIPFDPNRVLSRLQVKIRTPSPPPAPLEQPSSSNLPLKTPSNIIELEGLQKRRQKVLSPTDRALAKIVKGCQLAMHSAILLHNENSQLRAENARQKRKRAQRRAFIQTGGTMTIGEGLANIEARQKPQRGRKARPEAEEGEAATAVTAVSLARSPARTRAQPKCSICRSIEHNARTCPSK
jgi:hypothetical protein